MSATPAWMLWAGIGLTSLALAIASAWILGDSDNPLRRAFRKHQSWLARELRAVGSELQPRAVLIRQGAAILGLLLASYLFDNLWLLGGIVVVALWPRVWLGQARAKRLVLLHEQLEHWLQALANGLRANPSLGESLASSARLVPSPMRDELQQTLHAYRLGEPLDQALEQMAARIGSTTFRGAIMTLTIARRTGGDLPSTLETTAQAIRETARLEGVVQTKTAEGKAQAFVMGAMPLPFVALLHWMEPGLMAPLVDTFQGHIVIAIAGALWLAAILLSRKILAVDI